MIPPVLLMTLEVAVPRGIAGGTVVHEPVTGVQKTMTLPLGLLLISILGLSCLSTSIFKQQNQALAQRYIQTIKYRNLVIDLGNGVKINAQLTLPDIGKGPFPGVLLISGSGANDKNGTLGFVHKNGPKPLTPFLQIAQYLSERGFAVLRYDKRGIGANTLINHPDHT